MKPLCVVHVMEATIGGTRRHLRDVAAAQRASGAEVHVIAAARREPRVLGDFAELEARGVRVHRLDMRREISPAADARDLGALKTLLREIAPEVVHTHSSKAGVLGRVASLSTGIGVRVHTPHTFAFVFDAMFSRPKRALFRAIEKHLARRTHAIVAVSTDEARTIEASGVVPAERLRVVHNGIDARPFVAAKPLERATLGVPADAPLVLVAGLLNAAKGQDLALEALAREGCERAHLLVAGDGELRTSLEERARALRVADRVRFLGWREDVPALLATCDVVLLPSRWEGMPYVALEALACARPLVATPVDGARELLAGERCGILASAAEPAAIASALARMLALPADARERMGAAGRELVLARHTLESMSGALIELYEDLVRMHGIHPRTGEPHRA